MAHNKDIDLDELYDLAKIGLTEAQIFFLKNRAQWTDRVATEHTGSVGFDMQLDAALSTLKEAGIDPASL
jgi:hypothetical protein